MYVSATYAGCCKQFAMDWNNVNKYILDTKSLIINNEGGNQLMDEVLNG